MKIFAVTVLYEPDPELLRRSLDSYADAVDTVWVWRNSPLPDSLETELLGYGNVVLAGSGENKGIAAALNAAARAASEGGFDTLLTMDQDSVWHGFREFLRITRYDTAPAGYYVPSINEEAEYMFTPVDTAFTSGMLIPLRVVDRVGGWCEDFFVDGIDNEFCLHALSLGIRAWKTGGGYLEHRLGTVAPKRFLGLRFLTYNYSPERLYGIYRNNLIAIRRYPSVSRRFRSQFLRTWGFRRPLRMLLGEKDLRAKFRSIYRGIRDAKLS